MSTRPEWEGFYDTLADVYDRWLEGDQLADRCRAFYVELLRDSAGPVLELGVGTGRVARALASAGVPVVGLDGSTAMLTRARAPSAAAGAISVVRGYFEALPFSCAFRAVICPQRSIGHLTDTDHLLSVLEGVFGVLLPGGRFVFDADVFNPTWALGIGNRSYLMYEAKGPPGEDTTRVWNDYEVDVDGRRLRRTVRVEREAHDGLKSSSATTAAWSRWFDHDELDVAARSVGFEVEECLGSFAGHPYRHGSARMIWKLRRPGE